MHDIRTDSDAAEPVATDPVASLPPESGGKTSGAIVAVVGAIAAIFSFFMETTAPFSDTLNMGLMQLMVLQLGCAIFIAGTIAWCAGLIIEQLTRRD